MLRNLQKPGLTGRVNWTPMLRNLQKPIATDPQAIYTTRSYAPVQAPYMFIELIILITVAAIVGLALWWPSK